MAVWRRLLQHGVAVVKTLKSFGYKIILYYCWTEVSSCFGFHFNISEAKTSNPLGDPVLPVELSSCQVKPPREDAALSSCFIFVFVCLDELRPSKLQTAGCVSLISGKEGLFSSP